MIVYLVYTAVFLILCFVLYIAAQAVNRGVAAKQNLKEDEKQLSQEKNLTISDEIQKLKDLRDEGALNQEEYEKAKKKLLEN